MHKCDGWDRISKIQLGLGDHQENYDYCTKGGSFFEYGTRLPHKGKGNRTDLDNLKDDIGKGMTYDEICDKHFNHTIKYHKFIKERVQARDSKKVLDSLREDSANASLLPWQRGDQESSSGASGSPKGSLVLGEGGEYQQDMDHEILGSPRGCVLPGRREEIRLGSYLQQIQGEVYHLQPIQDYPEGGGLLPIGRYVCLHREPQGWDDHFSEV